MNSIQILIQDYLSRGIKGEAEMPSSLIFEFKEACGQALEKQFSREPREHKLRLSALGKPLCQQQSEQLGIEQEFSYNAIMRFLLGDLVEASLIAVMKAAGIEVQEEQQKTKINLDDTDINGTLDVVIDDKVYDIKSASPYAFQNKFGKFGGYAKVKEDDPFGYVVQGYAYAQGVDKPFGGWIVVDKSSGEVTVCEAPDIQEQDKQDALDAATVNVRKLKKTKRIEKQFKPTDEIDKGEPTGNKLLPRECGFCGFRHNCWSKAQFLPKHTSRAKNPPYVWYTKVAKNAHT